MMMGKMLRMNVTLATAFLLLPLVNYLGKQCLE